MPKDDRTNFPALPSPKVPDIVVRMLENRPTTETGAIIDESWLTPVQEKKRDEIAVAGKG